jgi:glycosyltransferase involved in cell wall biosynthesis
MALQAVFWGGLFLRLAWYRPQRASTEALPAVSVIVCARNEAVNLQKNLEYLLQQDYPIFELLLVDDASQDATPSVLRKLQKKYFQLRVLRLEYKTTAGKKAALSQGIAAARYAHLLLTDADCRPASDQWIRCMAAQAVQDNKALVLGYGPYNEAPTWLNRWVQFETVFVLLQYASMALWGQPYMGVGRNLWYEKRLFEQAGGFERHLEVISGDDDLLVNQVATGHNTGLCLHPDSFVYSPPPQTWRGLYQQKTRHYSSSTYYRWQHQLILGLLAGSQFFFYTGLLLIIATNAWNCAIIVMVILRSLLLLFIYYRLLHTLRQKALFPYVLLMDALLPFYYLIFAAAALGATRPTIWNRR